MGCWYMDLYREEMAALEDRRFMELVGWYLATSTEGQADVATAPALKTGEPNSLGGSTPPPSANLSTPEVIQ